MKKILILIILFSFGSLYAREEWSTFAVPKVPHRFIKDIVTEQDYIWFGTANGVGLYSKKEDKLVKIYTTAEGLPDNYVKCIALDGKFVWIGTANGLARLDREKNTFVNFTKKDGLTDNFIQDIMIDGSSVWIGTKNWGINVYDKDANIIRKKYSLLEGLSGNSVNCIVPDGSFIWVGTEGGLSVFSKSEEMWESFDMSHGLPATEVKAIAIDGDNVWCGTRGGCLSLFNKNDRKFKSYTVEDGIADSNIEDLLLDGSYLWIATFSGVTKYDKSPEIKTPFKTYTGTLTSGGLADDSVSTIALDGNYIWFGTDGGGASRFNKEVPQASLSPLSYYTIPGEEVTIIGTAFHYSGIQSYSLGFKLPGLSDWLETGLSTGTKTENTIDGKLGTWDVKGLLNTDYEIRLLVTDKQGKQNAAVIPITVDTIKPLLTVDSIPDAVKQNTVTIRGSYDDANLREIVVKPGNFKADIQRMMRKFSCEITLQDGINNLEIIAYDIANQSKSETRTVTYDRNPPVITLDAVKSPTGDPVQMITGKIFDVSLKRIVVNPGNIEIDVGKLTVLEKNSYKIEATVNLEDGKNNIEVTAYDNAGYKSVASAVIECKGTLPTITIDKSVIRTSKPDFVVRGRWSGRNMEKIYLEPGNINVKINNKDRTFDIPVKLSEGENLLTVNAINKEGIKGVDMFTVLYSTELAKIWTEEIPKFTMDKKLKIAGKFQEQNIDRIEIQPFNIRASIDSSSSIFNAELELKSGENPIEINMFDKVGSKQTIKSTVVYDNTPPELTVDELPDVSNSVKINIRGSFKESNIDRVVVSPGEVISKLDAGKSSFSCVYELKEGANKLTIIAYDKALNKTTIEKIVNYVPQTILTKEKEGVVQTLSEDTESLQRKVEELEARIEELKKVKQQVQTVQTVRVVSEGDEVEEVNPPKKSAFFFVPYNINRGDTLAKIANKYLGAPQLLNFISSFNDDTNPELIKRRNKLLIPTKALLRMLEDIKDDNVLKKVVGILAESYNNQGVNADISKYREEIIRKFTLVGILSVDDKNRYSKKNEFNIGDKVRIELKKSSEIGKNYMHNKLLNNGGNVLLVANFTDNYLELQILKR